MKRSHVNDQLDYEATGRNFVYWNTDAQAQMLRSKLADGGFPLVPYSKLTLGK